MKKISQGCLCIEGKNIYLRKVRISDGNEQYRKWMEDPEINQFLESRFEKWPVKKLKKYIKNVNKNPDYLFLAIIHKTSKKRVGNIKLGPINRRHKFADIGIIIGEKEFWGKGLASEAIRLITDYAFNKLKLHKLTAGAYISNLGSTRAFEKVGFKIEGVKKKHYFYNGTYVDAVLLGMVNS